MTSGDQEPSLVHWRPVTLSQFTYAVFLILTLAFVGLGFEINEILNVEVDFDAPTHVVAFWLSVVAMLLLFVSVLFGTWLVFVRLRLFRATMNQLQAQDQTTIERFRVISERLDRRAWRLFRFQATTFGVGVSLVVLGVLLIAIRFFVSGEMPEGCDI